MADNISKEDRRRVMQAVKSRSKLENKVSRALWDKGLRFRKNVKDLYGKPDIAIKKYKVAIFIDSCFWHKCPQHTRVPKSNQEFWMNKLIRNEKRDVEVSNFYNEINWTIIRIWEHEIKEDFNDVIDYIVEIINKEKKKCTKSYPFENTKKNHV